MNKRSLLEKTVLITFALVILTSFNYAVYEKEILKKEGRTFYLRLAPVDPRSLIQGDYMRLRYAVENEAVKSSEKPGEKGFIVLSLDSRGIGSFERYHMGEDLADNEVLIKYVYGRRPEIKPNSFMFQEGNAPYYRYAAYGVFIAPKQENLGRPLLVGLAAEDLSILGPKRALAPKEVR